MHRSFVVVVKDATGIIVLTIYLLFRRHIMPLWKNKFVSVIGANNYLVAVNRPTVNVVYLVRLNRHFNPAFVRSEPAVKLVNRRPELHLNVVIME